MVEFDYNIPGTAVVTFMDSGFLQRNINNLITDRIDRKGSHYRVDFSFGPVYASQAGVIITDLIAGKREGIRVPFPLTETQGPFGVTVVNGNANAGTTLAIKGFIPGAVCRKRFWLSIESSTGGHYLHQVETGGFASADGLLTVKLNSELRHSFVDGNRVHMERPIVQGWIDGEEWAYEHNGSRIVPINFTVEEAE